MPSSVTISPRLIFVEDISLTTNPTPQTVSAYVEGVGTVSLTQLDPIRYSSLGRYVNDSAAAIGGVPIGGPYYSTTYNNLHTRMS